MNTRKLIVRFAAAILLLSAGPLAHSYGQQINSDNLSALGYRYIGPVGNRVSAVAGVPGQPNVYYAGAASGGIFKTTDGGVHWQPIFDDQPVSSIGSLAVAPSDPNIVWAGTGEAFIRSHISVGSGIYKSNDAGKSWSLMGLERTGRIARVIVDPRDPNIVFAAAMGHSYGPQSERGAFRTTDGGKTWEKVLFTDENTGCSDMAMDPNNPRILFAGMWPLEIHTWSRESGGPGSGLFKSRMAAPPGSGSPVAGFRLVLLARSLLRSREPTQTEFTRLSRPATAFRSRVRKQIAASCGDRMMAARAGGW